MNTASIYDIPVRKITGTDASLAEHKGKVVLVVNVASKCGLTPQYEALEALYRQYRDRGFQQTDGSTAAGPAQFLAFAIE